MKKIILLILLTTLITGCVDIKNSSYEQIINNAISNENINLQNESYNGYSYYLPRGLSIKENNGCNVVFKNDKYVLYMYVDLISYFNKVKESYVKNNNAYYSSAITNDDKFGYLEINLRTDKKYLVEIMYNYAKIEVIVDECDIKEVVSYAIAILSSISYNDTIIENMIGEDILNYNEVEFNIFETANNESNLIEYDDADDDEIESDEELPDTDLIN
jgi:hypothetical protein